MNATPHQAIQRGFWSLLALASLLLITACAGVPDKGTDEAVFTRMPIEALPGLLVDDIAASKPALVASCAALQKRGTKTPIETPANAWKGPCSRIETAMDTTSLRSILMDQFIAYKVESKAGKQGLFTGYYVPLLEASRVRGGEYQTPLYARPGDLVEVNLGDFREELKGQRIAGSVVDGKLKPYADRTAIDAGALSGKGLELYWAKDPIAVFFLQVQGSGMLQLPDGTRRNIGYSAQNGHPYKAIGKELIARGELEASNTSLQTIRAWLLAHPDQAAGVMQKNPSYVFFRDMKDGATGAAGVVLTPGRSLAVDNKFISYNLPLWLDTTLPSGQPVQRLMVAQDTGGAITGVVRGDVFFGAGDVAEHNAGLMKQAGEYYILVPQTVRLDEKTD